MKTFHLPDLGEGLAEAEIVRWHVNAGDHVKADDPMVAVETAKAIVEVPAPFSGVISATHGQPGDLVATGALLVEFEPDTLPTAAAATDSVTVVGSMPASDEDFVDMLTDPGMASDRRSSPSHRVRAIPAARALARRLGIDLEQLRGTGRGELVTVDDVLRAVPHQPPATNAAAHEQAPAAAAPRDPAPTSAAAARQPFASNTAPLSSQPQRAGGNTEQLRGSRRAMAQSMALARDHVASCTLFDDADLHDWLDEQDITIRLLRAIAAGCAAEPGLNAWFDGNTLTRKVSAHIDIAIAVDTPEGLVAPVVRNVAGRPVAELRRDVDRLKRDARERSVEPADLRDFTFMLSNFGMIAGRYATPVVVPPAVAILGCGRLSNDVVATKTGAIEAHLRMPLSLTFDHRCVTGGEAARFTAALIQDLQKGN